MRNEDGRANPGQNPWEGWTIEKPLDFEVGKTYVVRANHIDGFWADFLITITELTEQRDWGLEVETILDGSPGIVEGWMLQDRAV